MTDQTPHSSPGVAFRFVLADSLRLLIVDAGVMALLGFRPEDMLSDAVALPDRIHPDDADLAALLFASSSLPRTGSCNLRVRGADGRILCVRADHHAYQAGGDALLDLSLHDARALPRTLACASGNGSLAAMLENSDDFIYFKNRNHVFTGVSQSLLTLCSPPAPRTELLGLTDYDVFPEAYADIYYRLEKEVFAGAASVREVQAYQALDGRKGWVDNRKYPIHNDRGEIIGLYGIARDITVQLHAEAALHEERQRFRSLLENTVNIAVQGYDRHRRVIFWNHASELLYGYSAQEAMGQLLEDLIIPAALRSAVIAEIEAWVAGGPSIPPGESTLRRKDDVPVTVYSSHVMQAGADGPEMYCLDIDLSERKRTELELARHRDHLEQLVHARTVDLSVAKEAAEAASRAKSTFLANMSHELRTPMSGIIGMLALARRCMADAAGLDHLDKARQAADHLLAVLNDILDISRIEAERMRLEDLPLDLGSLFDQLLSVLAQKATEKGLRLEMDLPGRLARLPLRGDPLRLSQILINLAGNAVKFTERGGVIVRAWLVEETPDQAQVRIEVSDSGIGIDPEAQARLFNAFEQADNSMTRRYGGSGLGLAISKRLVGLMGGEIGVESRSGSGSTFWFTVRLLKGRPAPSVVTAMEFASAERQIQRDHAGARILLAEDEPINREVTLSLLEDLGIQADVAEDGLQALNLARQTAYALILMDMQMPNMNGVESARCIRADSLCRNTPILAMTANAFDDDRKACLAAGMNDFLSKPVEPERLFETLLRWLSAAG